MKKILANYNLITVRVFKNNTIILYGKFKIKYKDQDYIKSLMKEYDDIRKQSQPQKVNCCGSIFKNPKIKVHGDLLSLL